MKITQTTINTLALPPGKSEHFLWDSECAGFGLRIRQGSNGRIVAAWVFQYRLGRLQRRLSFGATGAMKATVARDRAEQFHAKVKLGLDPAAEKAETRAKSAETFEAAMRVYLAHQKANRRHDSYLEVERHLVTHARPFHRTSLHTLDQRAVASLLASLAVNNGPSLANGVRASLSAFYAWAMKAGMTDRNPVVATGKAKERGPRSRVLSDDELVAIWHALPGDGSDAGFGDIVRLLMLTGQRRDEIGGLRWDEVDMAAATITLPGGRTKNGREHIIPLSSAALAILNRQPRDWPDGESRECVFGKARRAGFQGFSGAKRKLDERITAERGAPLRAWTLHDVRRSVATRINELDIAPPHVVEQILNHRSGFRAGIAGTYNRASYARQSAIALEAWGRHLTAVVEGREPDADNVVTLGARSPAMI